MLNLRINVLTVKRRDNSSRYSIVNNEITILILNAKYVCIKWTLLLNSKERLKLTKVMKKCDNKIHKHIKVENATLKNSDQKDYLYYHCLLFYFVISNLSSLNPRAIQSNIIWHPFREFSSLIFLFMFLFRF